MTLLATDLDLTRNSYYAATALREQSWARLEGTTTCDVAVVGGGLAGLSAALELLAGALRTHPVPEVLRRLRNTGGVPLEIIRSLIALEQHHV